jgi:hypothetical protein
MGSRSGLWTGLGEQSRLGLDEDVAADQAFELGADVLGVRPNDGQVQGLAQVACPPVRAGYDLIMIADLLGHARVETVRVYTLPADADVQAALDAVTVDY